jgi:hypothetical protein
MKITIDSNTVSYLREVIDNYSPSKDNSNLCIERLSMIRIRFYTGEKFFIIPTVRNELDNVVDIDNWLHHKIIIDMLDKRIWHLDNNIILKRKLYFHQYHKKDKDCQILAEAEAARMDILLTCDKDFINRLGEKADKVIIKTPSMFWSSLDIQPGSKPKLRPMYSNPLYRKRWWKL